MQISSFTTGKIKKITEREKETKHCEGCIERAA